jgi:hypothetical protein
MRFSTNGLSSIYLVLVLTLTLTTQDANDRGNESSKLISTIIFGSFIKLVITTSLYEGPFFHFYAESSSSIFMHQLREHSCHSKYNVHCPRLSRGDTLEPSPASASQSIYEDGSRGKEL